MIKVDSSTINEWIGLHAPTWLQRAFNARAGNIAAGRHVGKNIWSDIKAFFLEVQGYKCAYCERQLGKFAIEWDVEHFRPKAAVERWRSALCPSFADQGEGDSFGYYGLAYDLRNYLAACKPCNTLYKANYFPTAAPRRLDSDDPAILADEEPYLLNPLDNDDVDPEACITFTGSFPLAVEGAWEQRALVTIEVLGLGREDLIRERAAVIRDLWIAYSGLAHPRQKAREHAQQALEDFISARSRHSNCARSFYRLCLSDEGRAEQIRDEAVACLDSFLRPGRQSVDAS